MSQRSDLPLDRILVGDVRERLAELPDESVHCVVTSPPYWGLRDYGVAGQLGLEASLDQYVETVVAVFAEVRRVLRRDGTLWLVMGDSYAGGGRGGSVGSTSTLNGSARGQQESKSARERMGAVKGARKQLLGQPWRVALALQADGWVLRADIVWHKPTAMPEAICDRPTKAHEYVFLLTRSPRYFYDYWAIAEPTTGNAHHRGSGVTPKSAKVPRGWDTGPGSHRDLRGGAGTRGELVDRRNARTVWTIQSTPYRGAHFAVYPEELVRRCVAAGTSDRGVCAACGASWVRVMKKSANGRLRERVGGGLGQEQSRTPHGLQPIDGTFQEGVVYSTTGWRPSCECEAGEPVPAIVLDPFLGSGTTALVALKMGRRYVGIELSPEYAEMAEARLRAEVPLLLEAAKA